MDIRPEGGDHLGSDMLQPAEHPRGRLETSLDGKKLLVERPRSVGRDLRTIPPSLITASFDGLASGNNVTREVLCARRKKKYEAGSQII